MVNQLEEEKEKLKDLLMKIEEAYGGNLNSDELVTKIVNDQQNLKLSEVKIQELLEKNNSILSDNQTQKEKSISLQKQVETLESQKSKLLAQNEWLEKQVSQSRQEESFSKIDTLERDISTLKGKSNEVLRDKSDQILILEGQLSQVKEDKEALNLELLKMQKLNDILTNKLEQKSKKLVLSGRSLEKPTKKVKTPVKDIKKARFKKQKAKEIKYHSDTEDIVDVPFKAFPKSTKSSKIATLKTSLQAKEEEVKSLEQKVAYLQDQNSQISAELLKLRKEGYSPQDSVVGMMEEIEQTRQQLEDRYNSEIQESKAQISQYLEEIDHLNQEKHEFLENLQHMKAEVDQFDKNLQKKDAVITKLRDENAELSAQNKENTREHLEAVQELKEEIESIKESNQKMIQLYEYQNNAFKERVAKELEYRSNSTPNSDIKESPMEYTVLMNDLAQRDSVLKTLKEENKQLKLKISQMKVKEKELKIKKIKEVAKVPTQAKNKKISLSQKGKKDSEPVQEEREFDSQDCHQILRRIALVEAENIKLTNEMHILNKNLITEQEQREELIEELESLREKAETQKAKKSNTKKEIQALTKEHKSKINKLEDEIQRIKNTYIEPKVHQKLKTAQKELEQQIKSLKDDISRKRDLIASLKQAAEAEAEKEPVKVEPSKQSLEKISKLTKELSIKNNTIKDLKAQCADLKEKLTTAESSLTSVHTKTKSMKSDLSRKETLLKETKSKYETTVKEIKELEAKVSEIDKHKDLAKRLRSDLERHKAKMAMLESNLETTTTQLEKTKLKHESEKKSIRAKGIKETKELQEIIRGFAKMGESVHTEQAPEMQPEKDQTEFDKFLNSMNIHGEQMNDREREVLKETEQEIGISIEDLNFCDDSIGKY